jgi:hypothetical protein
MEAVQEKSYTAFAGDRIVAQGDLETMLRKTWRRVQRGDAGTILVFEDQTGRQVDFDLRGSVEEVIARARHQTQPTPAAPGRGRPRLGVVSREMSLLPRHWEWLDEQPNGMSAALRRLVDEARRREPEKERARRARDAASRFMTAMAGDRQGFEEASRALFAGDRVRFADLIRDWPRDIRRHVARLAEWDVASVAGSAGAASAGQPSASGAPAVGRAGRSGPTPRPDARARR